MRDVVNYKIDTNKLSKQDVKCYVKIFSGLRGNKKIVVVDSDNDNDFSNEQIYEFDTLTTNRRFSGDTIELLPLIRVRYEKYVSNTFVDKFTYIRLKPYDDSYQFPNAINAKLTVYTINSVSKYGLFKVNNEDFKISAFLKIYGDIANFASGYYYKIQKFGQDFDFERYEPNKNQVSVSGYTFQVVEGDTNCDSLRILYSGINRNPIGGLLDFNIPRLNGFDSEGKVIEIEKHLSNSKFVLLDFWGSWCAPCIKSIPSVVALSQKLNGDKVQLIGVDFEYSSDGREKAKVIALKNKMSWPQISETPPIDKKGLKVAEALDVKQYPTLILIAPNGKVLVRETGEDYVKKFEEKMMKYGLLINVRQGN